LEISPKGFGVIPTYLIFFPFLQNACLLIVPLRSARHADQDHRSLGSRPAVVSTSVGIDGLSCRPGVDIMVADDPIQFAGAIYRDSHGG
jgi:hypothetical protein